MTPEREAVTRAREEVEDAITRVGDEDASHDEWVLVITALDTYAHAVRQQALAEAVAVVEGEEEAAGVMPDDPFYLILVLASAHDREGLAEVVRGTIRATKKSILRALAQETTNA